MEIRICKDRYELGKSAAEFTANEINKAIKENGLEKERFADTIARIGFDEVERKVLA